MCATIAATAVHITRTQIATAMAMEISAIASSFTFMMLLDPTVRGCVPGYLSAAFGPKSYTR